VRIAREEAEGAAGGRCVSYGLVICSACKREAHQSVSEDGDLSWVHCADKTPLCADGAAIQADSADELVGPYCGRDDLDGKFRKTVESSVGSVRLNRAGRRARASMKRRGLW